jgi:hypothetical protein
MKEVIWNIIRIVIHTIMMVIIIMVSEVDYR